MEFVLSQAIGNLELGTVSDRSPAVGWFDAEHLLALPAGELEGLIDESGKAEEMLISVLERFQRLCREYDIQTDYQLGAIHSPDRPAGQATISHIYTRIRERIDCPYYMERPAGRYLYLCCRGRWDLTETYSALAGYLEENQVQTVGSIYACDLAGFILNGVEKNAVSMVSVRLLEGKG